MHKQLGRLCAAGAMSILALTLLPRPTSAGTAGCHAVGPGTVCLAGTMRRANVGNTQVIEYDCTAAVAKAVATSTFIHCYALGGNGVSYQGPPGNNGEKVAGAAAASGGVVRDVPFQAYQLCIQAGYTAGAVTWSAPLDCFVAP